MNKLQLSRANMIGFRGFRARAAAARNVLIFWMARFVAAAIIGLGFLSESPALAQTNVVTHHNDTLRSGWNSTETILTPSNVAASLKLKASIALDDQVNAQPLVMTNVAISGQGTHNVVYIVTQNDSIYGLDASTGKQLLFRNLGSPVPSSVAPLCDSRLGHDGIISTPVIDPVAKVMYLVADTYEGSPPAPVWRIHEISLATLADVVEPVTVSGSESMTSGGEYEFSALYSRQRPALLEADGNIYAGFGSHCDVDGHQSRGWLLGWKAGTLAPLEGAQLTNHLGSSAHNWFLTSLWMSGAGPAAYACCSVFVVTANSDPSGLSFNGLTNPEESVVKISADLSSVLDSFTPSDNAANPPNSGLKYLDANDGDFGAGGVMLLPTQPPTAVAAGKSGYMFLLNPGNLGGYNLNGANRVFGTYNIGQCWCTESSFVGSDGIRRVVSSGGSSVMTWKLPASGTPSLTKEYQSVSLRSGQDPGFLTSVSSNGQSAAIIWAVARPNAQPVLTLYALNPAQNLKVIFSAAAGSWPFSSNDAPTVPVVANGSVYVAAYKQLSIFGLN